MAEPPTSTSTCRHRGRHIVWRPAARGGDGRRTSLVPVAAMAESIGSCTPGSVMIDLVPVSC